jgi:hypothetical protein
MDNSQIPNNQRVNLASVVMYSFFARKVATVLDLFRYIEPFGWAKIWRETRFSGLGIFGMFLLVWNRLNNSLANTLW